ncbi:MAG: DUF6701 domain-containing protein [Pseudomonadales bacterium]
MLHFGADQAVQQRYANAALPYGLADRMIMPYWDDLNPASGGAVSYDTLGTAPDRRFVVTWLAVPRFGNAGSAYSVQAVFYESGEILFRYGNDDADGASATIGIEESDTDFNQFSFNSVSVSDAVDLFWEPQPPPTPSDELLVLATDTDATLGGLAFGDEDFVEYDAATDAATRIFDGSSVLAFDSDIEAIHILNNGNYLFTTQDDNTANGLSYENEDIVEYNPASGTTSLFFNGDAVFAQEEALDAFSVLDDGSYLLSTTGGASIGSLNFNDEDVVRYDPASGIATMYFDGSTVSSGIADLTGVHAMDSGNLLMTFSNNNVSIGGLPDVDNGDVIEYDLTTGLATIYFDESLFSGNEDVRGVFLSESNTPSPSALQIVVASTASTCVRQNVTVRVCPDTACSTPIAGYTGTIDLLTSTSHGNWYNGATALNSDDGGSASYTFTATDAGEATFQLENFRAEILSITVEDSAIPLSETSGSVTFSDNAFVVSDVDSLVEGAGGENLAVAGRPHRYRVEFYRRDTSQVPANCAVVSGYNNAAQNIKAWITRSAQLGSAADPAIGATILTELQPAATNIVLDFSSGGIAFFDLASSDVGQFSINVMDDSRLFANNVDVLGSSSLLTVRPFAFDIDIEIGGVEDRATNGTAGASYASNASGSVFSTAGGTFTVELTAVQWQAADDANNDGQPDVAANLSNNPATQSFGTENTPEQAVLSSSLVAPAGGLAGALSGTLFSGFSFGQALRNDVSWSEVGIVQLNAQLADSNYLASGSNVNGALDNVGRFVPASFDISAAVLNEACAAGSFSYMGEVLAVTYNLTAQNAAGGTTQNYRGSFIKLDSAQGSLGYGGYASTSAINLSARVQPDAATFNAATSFIWGPAGGLGFGIGELSTRFSLSRAATPDGEHITTIGALVSDADNVTNAPLDLDVDGGGNDYTSVGATRQRYGRAFLENAFGPETRELTIPFIAEYYSSVLPPSGGFVPNIVDSCTLFALGDFSKVPGSYTLNLDAGDTDPVSISGTSYAAGRGSVTLSAPGDGNDGSVDIEFTVPAYLRFDWDGNSATADSSPVNTATFGSFRGNDRVIYRREVLQ